MAVSAKVDNRLPQYSKLLKKALNDGMNELARDVLIDARNHTPYSGTKKNRKKVGKKDRGTGGHLRMSSGVRSPQFLTKIIYYNKEYAHFQEMGGDKKRVIRKYTTAGTGSHFLENAIREVQPRITSTIIKHIQRVKV
jgi:hypothetical protein